MANRIKLPKALREAVWIARVGRKFNGKCVIRWCPNKLTPFSFEVGHNVPVSKGGTDAMENLHVLCSSCNKSMGDRYTIDQFNVISEPMKLSKKKWYRLC